MAEAGKSIKSIKASQPAGITTAIMLQPPPPLELIFQLDNTLFTAAQGKLSELHMSQVCNPTPHWHSLQTSCDQLPMESSKLHQDPPIT